ncbi:hypothetical protein C0992_003636 [Termitomyces sp. T32_za158]|nr:hypothetical protein C0992_003636 [Termitomyces sp. T32_za158]
MHPQLDSQRKRQQENSPEKQKGVRSHDRKHRHVSSTRTDSDMDESDDETYSSPLPLTIPPPNLSALTLSPTPHRGTGGDSTMVDDSPQPSPRDLGGNNGPPSISSSTPTPAGKEDPPWIIRRTTKTPVHPPFTQTSDASPSPQPPPKLPKSLTRTPRPTEGFPIVHLSTQPWFNLLQDQREAFDKYPDPKLWIRDWQASKDADLMVTSNKLKELVFRMTGERAKLSTPQQDKEILTRRRNDRQKPPYHFLISNISARASEILLAFPIMSTPEASAFILPYNPPLPKFLCTLEGFTLSIKSPEAILEAQESATEIVRRTLSEDETLLNLLKGKLVDDNTSQHNLDPAANIVLAIKVTLAKGEDTVDRANTTRLRKPLWNVFFNNPPPVTWTSYFVILQHIRSIKFVDMDYGSATLMDEENRLHCYNCKGADHNPAQCGFTTLERWYGNKAAEKIQETAEFVSSSKNERTRFVGGNRNDRRAEDWKVGCGQPFAQRRGRW